LNEVICVKCNAPLEKGKAKFFYLGHEMHSEVLRCPVCGQVFLPEKLVAERIKQLEAAVEDK
jgi:uncharacterized protein with PIN domain